MIVPDLNLLIYAVNEEASVHDRAHEWWESRMNGLERVGLPWVVLLGFLRLTTSRRVFSQPLSTESAWEFVDEWLERPVTSILEPTLHHAQILKTFILEHGTGGNLTTDAHLAALCVEHGATLCTADNDFARFASLKHRNPLTEPF